MSWSTVSNAAGISMNIGMSIINGTYKVIINNKWPFRSAASVQLYCLYVTETDLQDHVLCNELRVKYLQFFQQACKIWQVRDRPKMFKNLRIKLQIPFKKAVTHVLMLRKMM